MLTETTTAIAIAAIEKQLLRVVRAQLMTVETRDLKYRSPEQLEMINRNINTMDRRRLEYEEAIAELVAHSEIKKSDKLNQSYLDL
jgi:hypothetical protein